MTLSKFHYLRAETRTAFLVGLGVLFTLTGEKDLGRILIVFAAVESIDGVFYFLRHKYEERKGIK